MGCGKIRLIYIQWSLGVHEIVRKSKIEKLKSKKSK